jgi:hypothetical protein
MRSFVSWVIWTIPVLIFLILVPEGTPWWVSLGGVVLNAIGFLEAKHARWAEGY